MRKLLPLILSLFLSTPVLAQQVVKDQMFVFDSFSGGLNTKLSPFALPKNQAVTADNVRFNTELQSLTKRDQTIVYGTADATEPILGMHRLYLSTGEKVLIVNHSDEIEKGEDATGEFTKILDITTANHRWQWLTWRNLAIGCDGYNPCVKYDGLSDSATYLGSLLATDTGSGSGPNGTYKYKVTFYTASYESSFDTPSNTITVTDNDITLTMIPLGPDVFLGEDVLGRKVYRTTDGGTTYSLLSNGNITDNFTVTLTDSDADTDLGDGLSPDFINAPPKGKLNLIHRNRLWIANNPDFPSRLFYSEDDSYDYFLNTDFFNVRPDDGDEITFIINHLGILTVGKTNTIQKIYTDGDIPSVDWAISDPFSYVGCHAPYSAVNSILGILYLSNNGIYSFNGQYSQLVSDAVTPEILDIDSSDFQDSWGEYFKNSYYLAYPSSSDDDGFNNRILVLDIISNAYSIDLLNMNVIKSFKSGTDIERIYYGASDSGEIATSASNTAELFHNNHDDFNGTFDDMRFIPVRSGGVFSSPVLELAWDLTIDEMVGTIDSVTGIIDRPDTDGTYTSPFLTVNASALDKLFWNETLTGGQDVTFAVRTGATTPDTSSAAWSSEFTNPAGSDISAVTADTILQYRISATTDTITTTPNLFKQNNFLVKLTYTTSTSTNETSIPVRWESGWLDMGMPGYKKTLRKIYVFYESESTGTLNIKFTTLEGDSDTFAIDLATYPSAYREYFTTGALTGEFMRLDIWEDSLNTLKVKQIQVMFDAEPII